MTRRGVAHVLAAVSYLFAPTFMVWVGVDYIWPSRDETAIVLVYLATTAGFFWYGFGWMIHHLGQAARHRQR